jgi:serine/threonine protein kinase
MPDYVLIERLGAGNFGEVWLVLDRALNHQCAVKFIRPERIHDPSNFYHEPHTLVALQHEHIVRVLDAGRLPDDRLYISMEFMPRGSLEDIHRGAPVPLREALALVSDACRGAEHAHVQGIVHRDIKPANVLVSPAGRAKLSDFGLATRTEPGGAASPVGYLTHLAPEVIGEGTASALSDVYALGVTLYRLVNGDSYLPEPRELGMSIEAAIVAGKYPDRTRFREYVPGNVRRTIRKAIALDPAKRTKSAHDLRHDLERVMPVISLVEIPSAAVGEWQGESPTHEWRARVEESAGVYAFEISRHRRGGSGFRRSRKDCAEFKSRSAALRHARSVLQRVAQRGA